MAKLTKKAFIASLKEMNIKEVMELVEAMKEEFGIDPAVVAMAPQKELDDEKEVKTEFTITLKAIGGNKVSVIKELKKITGAGLMDAKKMAESAPIVVKENISKTEVDEIKAQLETAGAEISID